MTHQPAAQHEDVGSGLQALVRMLRILFIALRIAIIISLLWVIFGGVFYVREYQEAMLFRFGKLIEKDGSEILSSGKTYWAFPYPIDEVRRIPAQRSITITSRQFWPKVNPNRLEGAPVPEAQAQLKPGEGGYLLTGDANIMHLVSTITYRVNDAKAYYLNLYAPPKPEIDQKTDPALLKRGAEGIIESLLAQTVLTEVSAWPVEDVIVRFRHTKGDQRETLNEAVQRNLEQKLATLNLGIEIQSISIVESQPPVATQDAFREVVDAAQDYNTELDKANAYGKRVVAEAQGTRSKILADARAYKTRVIESVKADVGYFEKVLEEYRKNPQTMLTALYTDTIRDVLNRVETKYVIHGKGTGDQEVRLLLGPDPQAGSKKTK